MNIFNFCGSGNSGGGGGGGLPQPMKVVDSSHGEQLIQADVPYTSLGSVLIQAPNMENAVVDSSCNTIVVYTSAADASGNAYVGMDSVTINAPVMKSITINPSQDSSTVYNIVDEGDVAAGYVGIEQVTVPAVTAAIDENISPENIKVGVTIIGVTGTFDYDYSTLYNRLVTI